jgi:hypothetical protein
MVKTTAANGQSVLPSPVSLKLPLTVSARVSTGSVAPLAQDALQARQEELQAAWVELTEAAKSSRVTSFHVYTRDGRPWTDDPDAVRAVAASLREFPALNNP